MSPKSCLLCLILLAAAGCTTTGNTEKNFLCDAEVGTPCASLSEVDDIVSGHNARSVAEDPRDAQGKSLSQQPLGIGKSAQGRGLGDGGPAYVSARYRIPEKTGALWVAPRLDENQVLHEATYVHFVIREARWGNR
ncbi:TraV family lipoprotein [uncultured Roseobacter sp.]|uniref:TraV family lipoprotein n=1 Tax=uncultured Roseobacter sp. TaxID=114847 RepID=UPI00261F2902|nr:TraV family lipoprotein [uncultured Roseobacter sp.]